MQTLGLAIWAGVLLLCHALWGWVPILDSANLAFHEAGHPLFGLLSNRLAVYGGTLMQLLIPAACVFEMHRQRNRVAKYFCVIWFAENLLNIARYMADARAHQLPLVGGLDPELYHDWTHILSNWGVLSWDTSLAHVVRLSAFALMVCAIWRFARHNKKYAHEVGV